MITKYYYYNDLKNGHNCAKRNFFYSNPRSKDSAREFLSTSYGKFTMIFFGTFDFTRFFLEHYTSLYFTFILFHFSATLISTSWTKRSIWTPSMPRLLVHPVQFIWTLTSDQMEAEARFRLVSLFDNHPTIVLMPAGFSGSVKKTHTTFMTFSEF